MQQELEHRSQLEKELWLALANKELMLYYQLIINDSLEVVGAEALLRWRHPEKGIIGPDEFLSLVEKNNMIIPIGDWVIDEGLRQLQKWQQCELFETLVLSLNISVVQFQKVDFVAKLEEKIKVLRSMGIHISIDDFGTGYSSLSYLKQFKLNQLKIERLFVRDILIDQDDLILVKTIINMGQNLGMDVVAEGVENQRQYETLSAAGCKKFQGYWINRPMTEEEINDLLKSGEIQLLEE